MAQIPNDQKFHTLSANTPTVERGSAQADALREIYTMQDIIDSVGGGGGGGVTDINGESGSITLTAGDGINIVTGTGDIEISSTGASSSFRAVPTQAVSSSFSKLVFIDGVDATTGLPTVATQISPTTPIGSRVAGILSPDAVRYEPSDVIVSGEVENLIFLTPSGGGAEVGDTIGAGSTFLLAWGGGQYFDDGFPVGRILTTPTLVQGYATYDTWSATILVTLPTNTAYYHDKVSLNDSLRLTYTGDASSTVDEYNIVKCDSNTGISIERWDPAGGDTVDQIRGVTPQGFTPGANIDSVSVCTGGIMRIPQDVFVSGTTNQGDAIYSDSATPYLLTASPTSGVRIGFVVKTFFDTEDNINIAIVQVEPDRSGGGGGGSTTGEDLSLNVRSNPYSAAGDHEGTVLSLGTLGLTVGTVYHWNGTEWADANAGAVGTADGLMGIATDTGVSPDVLVTGIIQLASVPGAVGDPLYLDTTNGLLTATAPSGSGDIVRVMGYKLDTNRVYFNPSGDFFEIA